MAMTLGKSIINFYAGEYVDRLAHLRADAEWLQSALLDANTVFLPLWQARSLVAREADVARIAFLESSGEFINSIDPANLILLGRFRERVCFAYALDDPQQLTRPENAGFAELHSVGDLLDPQEAGLMAYARAMVLWRERHRFCGKCGTPTLSTRAGHVLKCSNAQCAIEIFPRIDPAIIVLVADGDRALLGRQASWAAGNFSTLAGYVEPGESLEDAVRREVREEAGIETGEILYHSSQPWPFPSSMMLGFLAQATTTEIVLHDAELEDARWFTRAEIAAGAVRLPSPQSISLRLIESWYDAGAARPLRAEPNAKLSWARR
jgi:NAD+ diphosphatase